MSANRTCHDLCPPADLTPDSRPVEGGSAGEAGAAGAGGNPVQTRATISGDVTWTVTFDAAAQAAGATDCAYTRHYEGEQDQSRPWVCPSCEVTFRAAVEVTEGLDDCFAQISDSAPMAEEWIGYGGPISC